MKNNTARDREEIIIKRERFTELILGQYSDKTSAVAMLLSKE